ncbi:electron transfer flavoprotein subunit beta/FixA family protein [Capnocytophaga canimorsus]|uniref:electron transfer flavoprotein subunit beta/FixA family protein n=1 Tax=Capnocytophaga canimorsus TaxID=28188 RepID=UPI0037D8E5D4
MKILVCISNVPDTTSKINFTQNNQQLDASGVQFVINPNDEFGLTKALMLKEKHGAQVTVIHVGEAETEPTLRKALAIGADDAIRINTHPIDGFFVASQIAKVASENQYDLIITGKESLDYNGGMVGGMIAALLDYPFVDKCISLEIKDNSADLEQEIEGGKALLSAKLPLVIAGQKGLVHEKDLRIPNMRSIMTARTKPLSVLEGQPLENQTQIISFEKPSAKKPVTMIPADDLDQLVDLLHNEAKVI